MSRRTRARAEAEVQAAVLPLVDLCRVAASAGVSVPGLLRAVAPRAPAPIGAHLAGAVVQLQRGRTLHDVLGDLGAALGADGTMVCEALARAAATGTPLAPALDDVAATVRDRRRRSAQEAARRLPVTLLIPLVLCTLPAAVLMAVVPVIVVSLRSLAT